MFFEFFCGSFMVRVFCWFVSRIDLKKEFECELY